MLRDVEPDDLEVFFAHQADPAANAMAAFPARDRAAHMAHWQKILGDESLTARTIVDGGEVVGHVGSWVDDGERQVAYWIGREYWGRGLATRALAALLAEIDERPVHARVAEHNVASVRVLVKCGFSVVGTHREPGDPVTEVLLRLDGPASRWPLVADLPLVIEGCTFERLHTVQAHDFQRVTTHVRLTGGGTDGLGEDISIHVENGTSLHETTPDLPLRGAWTIASFADHLATLDLWPEPPEWPTARNFRNWAFESAALDLALRQAGRPLHEVLGLEPAPVRFVNSLGLGEQPSIEPVRRRLARAPGVRFKLDAQAMWTPELVDAVAATGAVDTIDFKGHYGFEVEDPEALAALYDRVLAAFPPTTYLEDPHDLPEITERLAGHLERVSYDAPITSAEDIGATPLDARVVNVKPSRIGSLRRLFDVYARCEREGRPMYGGGMGELGVGRGQIELLAALFHPDAPNDVAPSAYNEDDPSDALPGSPLDPRPEATGFRRG